MTIINMTASQMAEHLTKSYNIEFTKDADKPNSNYIIPKLPSMTFDKATHIESSYGDHTYVIPYDLLLTDPTSATTDPYFPRNLVINVSKNTSAHPSAITSYGHSRLTTMVYAKEPVNLLNLDDHIHWVDEVIYKDNFFKGLVSSHLVYDHDTKTLDLTFVSKRPSAIA